jgi:hypothetical protein
MQVTGTSVSAGIPLVVLLMAVLLLAVPLLALLLAAAQPRKGWHSWPVTPGRQANRAPPDVPGPAAVLM